ncbi:MAG: hypothetical protein PHX47_03685 [Candidatus ainarchaeum sp.]|nr:hypothetical protein [Candidatus ainarchaeum sp.]
MTKIIAYIYTLIGLIIGMLDWISGFKFSLITFGGVKCALEGSVDCVASFIEKIIVFTINSAIWPLLLLNWIVNNFVLVIILIIIVIVLIIYFKFK